MKVAILPSAPVEEMGAVELYRMAWPAQAVQAARPNWEVKVYDPRQVRLAYWKGEMLCEGIDTEDLDLLVAQRLGKAQHYAVVAGMQKQGAAVVIDIDDALWSIDRDNAAYQAWNGAHSPLNWRWLDRAARACDLVTVTTKALEKRYAAHGRAEILPNGLPDHAYPGEPYTRPTGAPVVIGWSGSRASHPHDLEVVGGALAKVLEQDPNVMVKIIGDSRWAAGVLGVPQDRLVDVGHVPFDQYHSALLGTDVAIVPLQDTLFNRCKSSLKAMEYSAAGAYVLASWTPANKELQGHIPSVDLVRDGEDKWYEALHSAVKVMRMNPHLVTSVAERGARTRAINDRAGEWISAWERAVNRRKALDS